MAQDATKDMTKEPTKNAAAETGRRLQFEVKLTAKDLWAFSMYHSNGGFRGIFNLLFSLAALFLLVYRWGTLTVPYRLLLVVCVLLFTVWQPFLLYTKARKQAKAPVIRDSMRLTFDEDGLKVEQNEQAVEFTWDQMGRMDRMPSMIVLYMDRVHAYLLPRTVIGEREEELCGMARKHLPRERRRRI